MTYTPEEAYADILRKKLSKMGKTVQFLDEYGLIGTKSATIEQMSEFIDREIAKQLNG